MEINITIFILAVVVFVSTATVLGIVLLTKLFKKASGLSALIERFPAHYEPHGHAFDNCSVRIGAVTYRFCVRVNASPAGFFLELNGPVTRSRPILIPWAEIRGVTNGFLWWRKTYILHIGNPKIAQVELFEPEYRAVYPFIRTL